MSPAIRNLDEIQQLAEMLLHHTDAPTRPVRLLGVSVHNLVDHPLADAERTTLPRLPFEEAIEG